MDAFITDVCLFLLILAVITAVGNFALHYITTRRYNDVSAVLEKLTEELDKKIGEVRELNKIRPKKNKPIQRK